MKLLAVCFIISIVMVGCGSQKSIQDSSPETTTGKSDDSGEVREVVSPVESITDEIKVHIVREGESLSGIAQRYGVSVQALIKANNIENPNLILVNQELVIPGKDK